MKKCIVVLSGGPDSATVVYWAKKQGYHVHAITFNYGQIAQIEIRYAANLVKELGIEHKIIDLSGLNDVYTGVSSLTDKSIPLTSEFSQPIIVPFRNGIFLAATVAYATSILAEQIFYGAQGSDEQNYPDCRREFYKAFEVAARLGTELMFVIDAPFNDKTKSEILLKGEELGVPFHLTWSCYTNGPIHCGKCESCKNRKNAFREAEIKDLTVYEIT
jgi:7-cyano-7-deazaguanine synthase